MPRMKKEPQAVWSQIPRMDPRTHTDKAVLCLDDDGEEHWVPFSVIHPDSAVKNGESERGTLLVRTWWVNKRVKEGIHLDAQEYYSEED